MGGQREKKAPEPSRSVARQREEVTAETEGDGAFDGVEVGLVFLLK